MSGIRAIVRNGRFVVDEPTAPPEGTVLDLVVDDEGDNLTPEGRATLNEAIARSRASLDVGKGIAAAEVIARLRRKG